ncbi:hypothetical protein TSUD_136330 [Trifolium subterraneum]|uniref:ABC transporter domain-containing protein n=1 Tax=Trifolium subterraneum TaxID=3900 RepID=A0A2Z6NLP5_TRISU|nr:hypothetical protein TSUD_136330 [Trifolium subterraneum]
MTEVARSVVHEVLGDGIIDVDEPIVSYIVNVLADEDFDFGLDGEGAFDALGDLLVAAGCVPDFPECRSVCSKLSDKFGKHGLVKAKPTVRSLAAPFRMNEGLDDGEAPRKKPEPVDGPLLSERDKLKIERRKRKDERQREAKYQLHLAEMEAVRAGMPVACVKHEAGGGHTVKDIHMDNFTISVGGHDLIVDGSVTLSFGRHYGERETEDSTEKGNEANGVVKVDAISQRLEQIYKRLELIDADAAESRAASILAGLSFSPEMQKKATKTFSGGWRMRIALARALFIEPDINLLERVATRRVVGFEDQWGRILRRPLQQKVFCWETGRLNNTTKNLIRDELYLQTTFIDKFRYNAKRASLVQSRIKALDRLGHVDAIINDPDYKFEFPTPDDRPGAPIISFSDASFGYPGGPILFRNLNFGIDLDSRIAMVGPNGIGKSTILKLIAGELQPSSGTVFRSAKVRIAVFSQHHVDGLDLSSNPLLYMMRCYPGVPEQKLRGHLGSFGVTGNLALQPMYTLSGGQKSRVAFAKITFKKPHIILLDEPSNHLAKYAQSIKSLLFFCIMLILISSHMKMDLDAVEALIQGLVLFQGGILMVSHDEHLISGSVEELWIVSEGRVAPFHGSFAEYKKILHSS